MGVGHEQAGQAFAGIGGSQQDLQAWQQHLLGQLNLLGPGAETEVCLAKKQPMLDPRLLAAVRIMSASDPQEVRNRGIEQLGVWDNHLTPASEVMHGVLSKLCCKCRPPDVGVDCATGQAMYLGTSFCQRPLVGSATSCAFVPLARLDWHLPQMQAGYFCLCAVAHYNCDPLVKNP